ncbi:MAG: hypothetical protein ABJA37_05870 [Ferruginibacter sp.]
MKPTYPHYLVIFLGAALLLSSCATKIPVQSVTLMQQITNEGTRMHKINVAYVNKVFNEKTADINFFIDKEYLPEMIKNIQKQVAGTSIDMNKEWPAVIQKLTPQINATKDSLQQALMNSKFKVITKLNEDYEVFLQACTAEINLLSSAVKLNEEKRQIFDGLVKKISGDKIDAAKLEQILDNYLQKGSSVSGKILNFQNDIDNLLHN